MIRVCMQISIFQIFRFEMINIIINMRMRMFNHFFMIFL